MQHGQQRFIGWRGYLGAAWRCVVLSANAAFIACGLTTRLWLVVALHCVLLPVNAWRLWQARDRQRERHTKQPAPASP